LIFLIVDKILKAVKRSSSPNSFPREPVGGANR
jgi:hypothetical protein